jgi:hypothetical protein
MWPLIGFLVGAFVVVGFLALMLRAATRRIR